jgi:activator of 2-hydroxyglutaryl-CoA dehydratase
MYLRLNPRAQVNLDKILPVLLGLVFLDQILARVGLDFLKADQKVEGIKGLEMTSRCGITMKTDFTYLLNQGHQIEEVIGGLLDSPAKNTAALALKIGISSRVIIIGGLAIGYLLEIVEPSAKSIGDILRRLLN